MQVNLSFNLDSSISNALLISFLGRLTTNSMQAKMHFVRIRYLSYIFVIFSVYYENILPSITVLFNIIENMIIV
jgi:hypothetical protein